MDKHIEIIYSHFLIYLKEGKYLLIAKPDLTYSTQACSYQSINSTPCRLSVTYIRMLK
jgi:hypothetical protein